MAYGLRDVWTQTNLPPKGAALAAARRATRSTKDVGGRGRGAGERWTQADIGPPRWEQPLLVGRERGEEDVWLCAHPNPPPNLFLFSDLPT